MDDYMKLQYDTRPINDLHQSIGQRENAYNNQTLKQIRKHPLQKNGKLVQLTKGQSKSMMNNENKVLRLVCSNIKQDIRITISSPLKTIKEDQTNKFKVLRCKLLDEPINELNEIDELLITPRPLPNPPIPAPLPSKQMPISSS